MTIVNSGQELLDLLEECAELPLECVFVNGTVREVRRVSEEDGPNGRVILLELTEDGDQDPGLSVEELYDDLCNHYLNRPILVADADGGRARFHAPDTSATDVITLEVE